MHRLCFFVCDSVIQLAFGNDKFAYLHHSFRNILVRSIVTVALLLLWLLFGGRALQSSAVQCSAVQCSAVQCSAVQCTCSAMAKSLCCGFLLLKPNRSIVSFKIGCFSGSRCRSGNAFRKSPQAISG